MFFKYRISFTHFGKLIISQLCTGEDTEEISDASWKATSGNRNCFRWQCTPWGRSECGTNSVGLAASHLQSPAGLWRFLPSPSGSLLLPKHSINTVSKQFFKLFFVYCCTLTGAIFKQQLWFSLNLCFQLKSVFQKFILKFIRQSLPSWRYFKRTVSRDGFGFWWHIWVVLGLNRGRGQFYIFFLQLQWFYNAKSVFLAVDAS